MVDQPNPAHAGHHAPPWIWATAVFIGKHLMTVAFAMTVLGALATPMAQKFIENTVDDRLNKLEEQMDTVRREQAIMGADMKNLKELQRDTKRDTRMILQSLQRSERRND